MLQNATPLRKSATEPPNSPNISDKHVSCTAPATENASLQILFKCPMLAIVFGHALTSKCASRHNGVHFFDISTSKSGPELACFVYFDFEMCFAPLRHALFNGATSKSAPKLVCFVHFDLEMCFAPQRRALFRHLNFQKRSEREVFLVFSLANVLRTTTACNFSSHLPSGLRTRRFSEPTFRPSGVTNHWQNTMFRDFATFSRA